MKMKKILVPILILVLLCTPLSGCAKRSEGYKLEAIPDELTIDPAMLSEDTDNLLSMDETCPLMAALPEEGLYMYAIDPTITHGALVKFDGVIQYFTWLFTAAIAEPEMYVCDYNGDGKKDVAITFLTSTGQSNHNEELHILVRTGSGFEDHLYLKQKAIEDAAKHVIMVERAKGLYSLALDGKEQTVKLDGNGDFLGLYFDDVQDYTLGETITIQYKPGIVFSESQLPVYSVFSYSADVILDGSTCGQTNGRIELQ